ncbi:V4R domain-containing protein [Lachnotalea sp. AF33-28]|uniref:V4R domain-containing protein n=1 Tax=Lachnotalea sp. AF33-28 TaxID=2292046 RepID=UPI000E54688C|nr:V4R domain-containing protein [Lachnotalea sp. AF33-28]RHP30558.1 4-vinyl reductase [Lachnotalea sp. AF33-28]
MGKNVFLDDMKKPELSDYIGYNENGRGNLGDELPVMVYRLMEYSLREQLTEEFGSQEQIRIFRKAGYRAGVYFAEKLLDLSLELNPFIASLQARLEEFKIGVLRIESFDEATGRIVLTVSEDADCSGLPLLGETVCNYDEGFISGILSTYMGKAYLAVEIDCWATGDRVCRFRAEPVQ